MPSGTRRLRGATLLCGGLAMILAAAPASGQDPLVERDPWPWTVGAGVTVQAFSFSETEASRIDNILLVTVPVGARFAVGDRVRAELQSHWARASMDRPDGSSVTIDGPTDTRVQVAVDLVPGRLILTATGFIPTGSDGFSLDEVELAGAISADVLPFRISHWGAGGGGGAALTAYRSFGETGVALDVGYHRAGRFDPLEGAAAAYRPGDEVRLIARVDRVVGPASKLTLQVDGRRFGEGDMDGQNVFRPGDRVGGTVSFAFPVSTAAGGLVYAGYRHRSEGTLLLELESRAAQGMALAGAGVRMPALGGVLTPSAELRAVRRDDGLGQGYAVGLGSTGEWDTGPAWLVPGIRLRFGSVRIREGVSSGFVGGDLSLSIRFAGGGNP